MTYYSIDDRKRLGRFIGRARRAAGYTDTEKWASLIKRSTRVALGLERGESAGRKTYEAVETVLGWNPGACYEILEGVEPERAIDPTVGGPTQDASGDYVSSPGPRVDGGASDSAVLDAIRQMREDVLAMEQRLADKIELGDHALSERLDRLEGSGS